MSQTTEDEHDATRHYLELIRAAHQEWEALEARGDDSVQLSPGALSTIKEAVRADARHGAQVQMPPTQHGPYTLSELSLRSLVRAAVDSVPQARALRIAFEHAEAPHTRAGRGEPVLIACRISAHLRTRDLPGLAHQVRVAVDNAARDDLGLSDTVIDIHIEDLHDDDH